MNYENSFKNYIKKLDKQVEYTKLSRTGYPDFLVVRNNGLYLFEVKGRLNRNNPSDNLFRKKQLRVFNKYPKVVKLAFYGKEMVWKFFYRKNKNDYREVSIWE